MGSDWHYLYIPQELSYYPHVVTQAIISATQQETPSKKKNNPHSISYLHTQIPQKEAAPIRTMTQQQPPLKAVKAFKSSREPGISQICQLSLEFGSGSEALGCPSTGIPHKRPRFSMMEEAAWSLPRQRWSLAMRGKVRNTATSQEASNHQPNCEEAHERMASGRPCEADSG